MDWANRLILGDSLQVMASLSSRENLAGQVQMIYFDPPYGIKFSSNFQPEVGRRDVRDSDTDLTREPEVVKAYRDTWTMGTHSYLSYLRDRFILARTLLKDTGSIFVQISDENLHFIKTILDDIFVKDNFISLISYTTTSGFTSKFLSRAGDYILWYAKNKERMKYNPVFVNKSNPFEDIDSRYNQIELDSGEIRLLTKEEKSDIIKIPTNSKVFTVGAMDSQGSSGEDTPFVFNNQTFRPSPGRHWTINYPNGVEKIRDANRFLIQGKNLAFKRYFEDFSFQTISNLWTDVGGSVMSRSDPKVYVVQTGAGVVQRCMLMTSTPGDLVLDPTCGSGTTAYVAEQWGRRWITIDTSRVAVALARQRLLTAKFDHFKLRNIEKSPGEDNPFVNETIPHITLKSISQNFALDAVFFKYNLILDSHLVHINESLKNVTQEIRSKLLLKLQMKQKQEGKKNITDADERRWRLPIDNFEHWEVPFDTDNLYPVEFKTAIETYRRIWRQKMDEVNACIQTNAEQVELVDKPEKVNSVVRVSGPFTVESVMPVEFNLDSESPIQGIDEDLETFDQATNAVSFIENILSLLKREGVIFPGNRKMNFNELRLYDSGGTMINFEGSWMNGDNKVRKVAVSVGPQHGPVTGWQVENVIRTAYKHGFDDVVFAGFSFDAEAQAAIEDDANPKVKLHLAHISPDVMMGDLLKSTGSGQVFTVMGSPRIKLLTENDGSFRIRMDGVDIYDPIGNVLIDTGADKVAAWFIDSDYDGRTFCITQAFFPDRDAWKKLEKALKGVIDPDKFEAFSGTLSLTFPMGEHKKAAVKVIDPRGNEVMKVLSLDKSY